MVKRGLQTLIDTVAAWDGIDTSPHPYGGVAFLMSGVEIGHIHVDRGLVDIPFDRRTRDALIASGNAEDHHVVSGGAWVSSWITGRAGIEQAKRLLRLSYAQKRYRRSRNAGELNAELKRLEFDALAPPGDPGAPR